MAPFSKTPNALLHGALDALILKTLDRGPSHGYAIARFIEETTGDAVLVEEGSLYPGSLSPGTARLGRGRVGHLRAGPAGKLYRLTDAGREQLAAETATWRRFSDRRLEVCSCHETLPSFVAVARPDRDEIDEELDLHVEIRTRELSRAAWTPKRARAGDQAARRRRHASSGRWPAWREREIVRCT